jgi:hypothetical protein
MLQEHTPFSQSKIWQLQRAYFEQAGIDAWRKGEVPHYVTSNPFMGKTYAGLVFAFLRDLAQQGKTQETVYVLELGAGHGRLCYHFLKHFERLVAGMATPLPRICYILSDFAEENIKFWETHPRLQPYLEKGWLDFARVDATQVSEIKLKHSGKRIAAENLRQPLVVIANYFFDTIPHDLFYIDEDRLHQCNVALTMDDRYQAAPPAEMLAHVQLNYAHHYLAYLPYAQPYLNTVLAAYIPSLNDTYLLFPHTGIECIHKLKTLSTGGLLLLTADKGYHREEDVEARPVPQLVTHGSFSLSVNYHAMITYAHQHQGLALFPKDNTNSIVLGCLLFARNHEEYKETRLAYTNLVDDFGPEEFFDLKKLWEKTFTQFSIRNMISILKLSNYDARLFTQMFPYLFAGVREVSSTERWSLFKAVHRVWDTYYPLGEDNDLAFLIGELLFNLKFYREAITYFYLSVKIYGNKADTLYNIALSYTALNEREKAQAVVYETLRHDPEHVLTLQLLDYIENPGPLAGTQV